jgi:hypothetical protein
MQEARLPCVQQRMLYFVVNSMWITRHANEIKSDHHHSGSLTKAERLDYINAVKCLQNLPARSPANIVPGARSRVRSVQPSIDTAIHI